MKINQAFWCQKNKPNQTQSVVSLSNLFHPPLRLEGLSASGGLVRLLLAYGGPADSKWRKPCLTAAMIPDVSLQLNRPVGVVKELLPALVTLMAKVNMNERIVSWLDGFLD